MILGISGYSRSGKDTLASYLVTEHSFKLLRFSAALKELAYKLNPIVDSAFGYRYSDVVDAVGIEGAKDVCPEVLRIQQDLGNEARNIIDPDVWVTALAVAASKLDPFEDIVIPDVRFPNEAEWINRPGAEGYLVRIERPGVGPVNERPTETALDDWPFDYYLNNRSTPEDLYWSFRQLGIL